MVQTPFSAMSPTIEAGRSYHQAGQFDQAAAIYGAILQASPDHPEALHLMGLIRYQQGDIRESVRLICRAIAEAQTATFDLPPHERHRLRPVLAAAYNDLGCSYRDLGCVVEAESCFGHALTLVPTYYQPLDNLGDLQLSCGQKEAAIQSFSRLVTLVPRSASARTKLGAAFLAAGHLDQAELACYRTLDISPGDSSCHNNLGTIYRLRQQLARAEQYYQKAIALDPGNGEALHNLGVLYNEAGKKDQALGCFQAALRLKPNYPDCYNSLGQLYVESGRFDEAVACYQRALQLRPAFGEVLNNLGNAFHALGRMAEAEDCYGLALSLNPLSPECQNNLAMSLLRAGKLKEGFRGYEWRWSLDAWPSKMPPFRQPVWQGEAMPGRTLLIHCEQGFGDSLQFVRFLEQIKDRCGHLILWCPGPLKRLFQCLEPMAQVVAFEEALPDFDRHLPLMSLARILETEIATIPRSVPYLGVPDALIRSWRKAMAVEDGRPKIGLVWSTALRTVNDYDRLRKSIDIRLIHQLVEGIDAQFYSLQKTENNGGRGYGSKSLINIIDGADDFADTAAIIANLDLVIGIDTAVTHLAGALNRPTWVLLRVDSCWRWLLETDVSPWYPSARLFRQTTPNDWVSVLSQVRANLVPLCYKDAPPQYDPCAGLS